MVFNTIKQTLLTLYIYFKGVVPILSDNDCRHELRVFKKLFGNNLCQIHSNVQKTQIQNA
jgi:hypothetical protein